MVLLQAAACVAIVTFFRRRHDHRISTTLIAPLIGGIGVLASAVLAIVNFDTLAGTGSGLIGALPWMYLLAATTGAASRSRAATCMCGR